MQLQLRRHVTEKQSFAAQMWSCKRKLDKNRERRVERLVELHSSVSVEQRDAGLTQGQAPQTHMMRWVSSFVTDSKKIVLSLTFNLLKQAKTQTSEKDIDDYNLKMKSDSTSESKMGCDAQYTVNLKSCIYRTSEVKNKDRAEHGEHRERETPLLNMTRLWGWMQQGRRSRGWRDQHPCIINKHDSVSERS